MLGRLLFMGAGAFLGLKALRGYSTYKQVQSLFNPNRPKVTKNLFACTKVQKNNVAVDLSKLDPQELAKTQDVKASEPTAKIGEFFVTRLTIPANTSLKKEDLSLILMSPVLGPIDIEANNLASVNLMTNGAGDSIVEIASKTAVPAYISLGNHKITTQHDFPIYVLDKGKPIAKSKIAVKLSAQ